MPSGRASCRIRRKTFLISIFTSISPYICISGDPSEHAHDRWEFLSFFLRDCREHTSFLVFYFNEQSDALGITNIERHAGGTHDHCAVVPARCRVIVRAIIVILGFFPDIPSRLIRLFYWPCREFPVPAACERTPSKIGQLFAITAGRFTEVLKV